MGLLSFIEAPIHGIIHDLTTPVKEVERVLGSAITMTLDIVNQLIDMVKEIDNLFDQGKFAAIFLDPFKDAVMLAISGIDKLAKLIFAYGQEGFVDVKDTLEAPIHDAYALVKTAVKKLRDEYTSIINNIVPVPTRIINDSQREIHSAIEKIDNIVLLIKDDITKVFQVIEAKGEAVKEDALTFANNAKTTLNHDINTVGNMVVDDVSDLQKSVENRMKNESSAIDAFFMIIMGMLVIGIISLILATKSQSLMTIVITIGLALLISYFVF